MCNEENFYKQKMQYNSDFVKEKSNRANRIE